MRDTVYHMKINSINKNTLSILTCFLESLEVNPAREQLVDADGSLRDTV